MIASRIFAALAALFLEGAVAIAALTAAMASGCMGVVAAWSR